MSSESTTPQERARAMAVNATDDTTRLHGDADETETVMTGAGGLRPVPDPPPADDPDDDEHADG